MQCPKCKYEPTMAEMQRSPEDCINCGVNYQGHARHVEQVKARRAEEQQANSSRPASSPAVSAAVWNNPGAQPVVVVDINMNFWSMVVFMVKWVIASIPAAIILALILMVVGGGAYTLFTAISGYMNYKEQFKESKAERDLPPARLIQVPVSKDITYFDLGHAQSDNFAVMTVKSSGVNGVSGYSRISVDCKSAKAVVSAQAPTLERLNGYSLPTNYEPIIENTPRQYIARHACIGAQVVHRMLR